MAPSLSDLEQQKRDLLAAFSQLGDLRPGSLSAVSRRCGKPNCRCARPDHPGHGPQQRLTFKRHGKSVTVSLSSPAQVRKAQHEIAEFRKFQQLSQSFLEVNEQICRLRPLEQTLTPQEKKRPPSSSRKSPRK
jgi:hypothetical protein